MAEPLHLKMTRRTYRIMREALLPSCGREHKLYAEVRRTPTGFIVGPTMIPEDGDYVERTPTFVHLTPMFMWQTLRAFGESDADGALEVHSHPYTPRGIPSAVDDAYIHGVREDFARRKPESAFLRMVVGQEDTGFTLEVFDTETGRFELIDDLVVVGLDGVERVRSFRASNPETLQGTGGYARLASVRSPREQVRMREARIAVVGAGGTGWLAGQLVACLGVGAITMIDGDCVERVNLNRLVGVTADEIERGAAKVDCLARMLRDQDPERPVSAIAERFPSPRAVDAIAAATAVICCVDDPLARLDVLRLCVRHLVPALDLGSAIYLDEARTHEAERHAHAWLYVPGTSCCWLEMGLKEQGLEDEQLRVVRRSVGYVDGDPRESPGSVQTLNAAIVSQGLTLLEAYLLGRRSASNVIHYEERVEPQLSVRLRHTMAKANPACPLCGVGAFEGRGGNPFAGPHEESFEPPAPSIDDTDDVPGEMVPSEAACTSVDPTHLRS